MTASPNLTNSKASNTLTLGASHPEHLENEIHAQPTVQVSREIRIINGCHMTLLFPHASFPGTKEHIAQLLLAAFKDGDKKGSQHEASIMPVQSINLETS